jgi:hypothetical protein
MKFLTRKGLACLTAREPSSTLALDKKGRLKSLVSTQHDTRVEEGEKARVT